MSLFLAKLSQNNTNISHSYKTKAVIKFQKNPPKRLFSDMNSRLSKKSSVAYHKNQNKVTLEMKVNYTTGRT